MFMQFWSAVKFSQCQCVREREMSEVQIYDYLKKVNETVCMKNPIAGKQNWKTSSVCKLRLIVKSDLFV